MLRKEQVPALLCHCERCGHEWTSLAAEPPARCAGCKSPYWNPAPEGEAGPQARAAMTQRQFIVLELIAAGWGLLAWRAQSTTIFLVAIFFALLPFALANSLGWAPKPKRGR
jgi:hypothetical protein